MTLGEIQNENVSLNNNRQVQAGGLPANISIDQNNGNFHNTDQNIDKTMKQQAKQSQSDAVISFLRAARSGDLSKVLEFLESGQIRDINACNANGLNALHLAAKDGYIDIVSELLTRGIAVDNATKKGNTALHIASLAGQKEVLKLLLQYNANVNVQSLNGFTPLYMAAQENHDGCVRFLLAKGANPSLATEDGFTPLAVAMQQGHDKVVAVLLESDVRGKVRLPALHIAAKKNDVTAASLLLQNEQNPDVVSKSGFTPLHIAAHYGNVDIASLLIERGADVNFTAKHNITPLHVACKWGKTTILQLLLSRGARIDATTRDGLTPLHCAARSGHTEVIEILLQSRPVADSLIHARTKNGLSPLHMAAQGEHDATARMLLEHNAPVDDVTVDYLTALHVAAHCGHVRVAKLLLDFSADPNARALNGFTPLHIACKKNRIKIVELLLKHGASISATTESGLTPLHVASFMGCMNIVIYLLQHEANPDTVTVRGETPLHLAARANQSDIIRILLRNGAQVDARAREGQTPLHVASRLGNVDIIMLMLQHGADVEAATRDGYAPLHIAAKEGQLEIVNVLIDQHAQLEPVTKKGFSPLHLAAKYGKESVVQLLLQKGAKVDCQGKNDVTPLHVAVHYDHPQVVEILLEKGNAMRNLCAKNGHSALHIAAKKNQMDIAQQLLQHKADVHARSKAGFTPLHLAAQEGHVDMVHLLIENGADPNALAKNGLSPMHLCAQEDNMELARFLLQNGSHISERTKAGYTPLHIAAHYGQINMVKFLLENDANIEMTTNVGYTPLHQATQQGHTMVINLLLRYRANPNAVTNDGHTALSIANSLGYVTAVETLKVVTETSITNTITGVLEEKYKVVAPESMHETFLSDSEDECGDDHLVDQQQQYRLQYMATDDLKTHQEDTEHQMHYDTTNMTDSHVGGQHHAEDLSSFNHRDEPLNESGNVAVNQHENSLVRQHAADNVVITRPPLHLGFLVSFLVDARGGSMRGCRHSGVRVIVPPKACPQPTRITCRYVKPQRVVNPPPLMEGEALVSRILELSPVEAKFLGPVVLEIPHFGSLRNKEREIIILRSENGDTWREHTLNDNEDVALLESILQESCDLNPLEDLHTNRIIRIVTRNFPHFFAVVSRIRQEVHAIGPDGGTVSSKAVPQVQAIFPPNALTKKIRVGLQANAVDLEVCSRLLGQGVAVTPVVTVEPRRRKFHKAITLSIPAPKANTQGMVNTPYTNSNAPTLRLLCSITGGQNRAVWEDVTGSTPLAFVKDSVTFTTTVSARFWLMDCRNVSEASRMATKLYTYMTQVPFMVKFVVFAKRISPTEAKISIFCMTDDKEDKTLEHQEAFTEIAKSRDVEVLEEQDVYLEFSGQLVPVLKSGEQLSMKFQAFRENRLSFLMHIKDQEDPYGRVVFCNAPKVGAGEVSQKPICMLNISLKGLKEQTTNSLSTENILSHIDRGVNYRDLINSSYKNKSLLEESNKAGELPAAATSSSSPEAAKDIENHQVKLFPHLSLLNDDDWMRRLADELDITVEELNQVNFEKPTPQLREAFIRIGRVDIADMQKKTIANKKSSPVKLEQSFELEQSFDQKQIDQSAFDALSKYLNDSVEAQVVEKQAEEVIENSNVIRLSTTLPTYSEGENYQTSTTTAKDVCQTVPLEMNEHQDLDMIRLVAEEHTKQLLEEAQRNIENGADGKWPAQQKRSVDELEDESTREPSLSNYKVNQSSLAERPKWEPQIAFPRSPKYSFRLRTANGNKQL